MSGPTVTFRVDLQRQQRRPAAPVASPTETAPSPRPCTPTGPARVARQLALAYHIEALIDAGQVRDYAAVARALEVTRARVSQIVALRWLPTNVQEDILLGRSKATERQIRARPSCIA